MADDETTTPDYSFLPETFKTEDGYDTDGFKAHYDDLATFKSQADERVAGLPQEAGGYEFKLGENFTWPEGFDPAAFPQDVLGEDGKPVMGEDGKSTTRPIEAGDLIDPNDPDIGRLQSLMFDNKIDPGVMSEMASIFAGRELAKITEAGREYEDQRKALGPDGQSRIDRVTRAVEGMVSKEQAAALVQDITSADTLRALEGMIQKSKSPVPPNPKQGKALDEMSTRELIQEGLRQQSAG